LSAAEERLRGFPQPFVGDVSIEACKDWCSKLIQIFDDFELPATLVASPSQFALVFSWWVVINRQAKAILCLYDAGLGGDSIPLVRSMIEFCLWSVALSKDAGPLLATVLRISDDEET
jgi:hypothetical protein